MSILQKSRVSLFSFGCTSNSFVFKFAKVNSIIEALGNFSSVILKRCLISFVSGSTVLLARLLGLIIDETSGLVVAFLLPSRNLYERINNVRDGSAFGLASMNEHIFRNMNFSDLIVKTE
jgi:hypothetical protein